MQLDEGSLTFNANPDENTYSHREQDSPKDIVHVTDMGNQTPQHLLAVAHGVGESVCTVCVDSLLYLTPVLIEIFHFLEDPNQLSLFQLSPDVSFQLTRASLYAVEPTHYRTDTIIIYLRVGVNYFMSKGILDDSPKEIAKFIFCTRTLNWKKLRIYLDERRDVLDDLVTLHNFRNQFLPNALREFFRHIHAPEERGEYLETLITKFSHRFCACNPDLMRELGLSPDAVYVLCYSLILLSIDLTSPHVKNKMSKREFIRNTRRAAQNISEDFVGHLYDNIYLIGHVAA
ncbi:hypothetical protein HPG69_006668 [Diceros bicornis minor]|uniref:SEC7 domain-containing protein n=1 Tax=Diceros bicornis minor TaxID=77932 RepID=A0A7J7F6C2_DICBM|nr:hypothetical protein HPG69_006668 [Diceros bicornis minor]